MERTIASSLCRFKVTDEHLVTDRLVKAQIARAFDENRCYEFYTRKDIVETIKAGEPVDAQIDRFVDIRNNIFDSISGGDQTIKTRLMSDTRLSSRLVAALTFFHQAIAEGEFSSIVDRRIVIIKELPGVPTIHHVSRESTVIAHVGQGAPWTEMPSIYLGLKTFDALTAEQKKGKTELFEAFKLLLMVEERAIETGYSHAVAYPPNVSKALVYLVDEVIKNATQYEMEEEILPEKKEIKGFTATNRKNLLRDLNARVKDDELNFDYEKNLKALKSLERMARQYKKANDAESLREVIRLLVAASGHDLHEIRNRANLILDRAFAPKEFDAPLATRFINLSIGDEYKFEFELPDEKGKYFIRLWKNNSSKSIFLQKDIQFFDVPLVLNSERGLFTAKYSFEKYGHFDFAIARKKQKNIEWVNLHRTSGRINVIPDVKGEIILEIFIDIHGHTKAYWRVDTDSPGLVYNENGEVIRLGCFSDIAAHLEDLKKRYSITVIYLLGVQQRGTNRIDWAPEASSPSPFSPMSLVDIDVNLGGEEEFGKLVKKAHTLDIKVVIDIVPHINRRSDHLPDELVAFTYDLNGNLVPRSATDGRYGSWDDGKLLNYRKFEVWEWLANSIITLIEKFDIDGIRFDSAHAVPIMMKKNNYLYDYSRKRTHEEMVEGGIIVNEREFEHFITTGYYDCACRDQVAVPLHYYLMLNIERKLKEKKKDFFLHIAECFWGHERFLTRTGLIPYNSSLFKICENIIHGKTDVREIYHIYDNYFPSVLPEGTELLGILGNHDERRALNTFGQRGLRAAVALSIFMSNIVMDYEGSAEGEGWKVYLDNIYVNWNQFEDAAHRSLELFYGEWYRFHRSAKGNGYLVWANNHMAAAAVKFADQVIWVGAFNFADSNQSVSIQFDNPTLPIDDNNYYRLTDLLYSNITGQHSYYKGSELKISRINTIVAFTDRVKLLKLEEVKVDDYYLDFIRDSFFRLCELADMEKIYSNLVFHEIVRHSDSFESISGFIKDNLIPLFWEEQRDILEFGLKRVTFYLYKDNVIDSKTLLDYSKKMANSDDEIMAELGKALIYHNEMGAVVFMSAEAEPFSKSGGLADVVYELPRELVKLGEEVYVITGYYRQGTDKAHKKMTDAVEKYGVEYTGRNVRFMIRNTEYEVGVHSADVEGIRYYLLDHYEFFDGLYWGVTSEEKLRRRVAFARACAEVIVCFNLNPHFTFTNDAFAGIFNGIVRSDHYYLNNPNFQRNTFLHIIHNGGWQYFDAYERYEELFDLFDLFNLESWRGQDFVDPVHPERLSCMATGIRFSDRTITVSPSYAKQIEYASDGLEHILQNVLGISNAVGSDFRSKIDIRFNKSGFVERNYSNLVDHIKGNSELNEKVSSRYPELLKDLDCINKIDDEKRRYILTRMRNKLMLQLERGLDVDPDKILFSMIHRISEQKGFQLLLEASEGIFNTLGIQAVIGGAVSAGDRRAEEIAHGLYLLGRYYPNNANVSIGFQDVSVPLLSSDLFGMPSMHEPGGISQLEAFAAGCLVVARATGGLRDTVFPVRHEGDNVEGNGFLFSDFSSWAFYDAMERAAAFYKNSDEDTIYKARINAEKSLYFWDNPARKYVEEVYNMTETVRIL
ncbi:MAG: glycosyltransferase [bacterium]|nr:glycosyltransferase [bacterium]